MLQQLNERIHGLISWIVIGLIIITFSLVGVDYYLQTAHESLPKIEVNGDKISKQAIDVNIQRRNQSDARKHLSLRAKKKIKHQVLEELISNSVTRQAATASGFEVSPQLATMAILNIPQFQEDGNFSANRFQSTIMGAFYTPESFQSEVRQGMLLNQQRFAFIGTSFALPEDIKQFTQLYFQKRDYHFSVIKLSSFLRESKVRNDEISAYYESHPADFLSPEKLSIEYIYLSKKEVMEDLDFNHEKLLEFYEEHKESYLIPPKWKLAHLLYPFAGTDEANKSATVHHEILKLSEQLTQDPTLFDALLANPKLSDGTVLKSGLMDRVSLGEHDFTYHLSSLTEVGALSPPIKTSTGYEIFKVLAYEPKTLIPFEQVKDEIEKQLRAEATQERFADILERVSELAYQTPDSLNPVAEALNLPLLSSPLFSREGGKSVLLKNAAVIQAAFSEEVLQGGTNSSLIQLDNDAAMILRVKHHVLSSPKALHDVRDEIKQLLMRQKAKAKAAELGAKILNLAKNNAEAMANLSATYKLTWRSVLKAKRDAEVKDQEINDFAFSLADVKSLSGKSLTSGDYVLVQLDKILPGSFKSLDKEQLNSIKQQIETNLGMMDYELYVARLKESASVVRH